MNSARTGLTEAMALKRDRGEIAEDLWALLTGFAEQTVDAAIVYATSAAAFAPHAVTVELAEPLDMQDRIVFAIGAIDRGGGGHPAATRFVAFLLGDRGQAILRAAGFLLLPGGARLANGGSTHVA